MKTTSNKTQYKGVISAFVLLLAAIILSVSALYAWFADRDRVNVGNMSLSVVGANVTLGDITLTRIVSLSSGKTVRETETYRRDGNGYYLYENGTAVLENGRKRPLALNALTGGGREQVQISVRFKPDEGYDGYEIYFDDIRGDLFEHNGATHNVGCAFQYFEREGVRYLDFCEYREEGGEALPSRMIMASNKFGGTGLTPDENGYCTDLIFVRADFTQLQNNGVDVSALAGKGLNIGTLGVKAVKSA